MMEKRYFQVIAGENIGEIKVLKDVVSEGGLTYLEFTDGELMNRDFVAPITNRRADLKSKVMVEISSRENCWTVEDIKERTIKLGDEKYAKNVPPIEDYMRMDGSGENTTVNSYIGGKRLVPPKHKAEAKPLPTAKRTSDDDATIEEIEQAYGGPINKSSEQKQEDGGKQIVDVVAVEEVPTTKEEQRKPDDTPRREEHKAEPEQKKEDKKEEQKKPSLDPSDPVSILVGSSKKTEYDLDVHLTIKLPQKSLYTICAEQFDGGKEKFIQCILDGLDTSEVIKSIGDALRLSYES